MKRWCMVAVIGILVAAIGILGAACDDGSPAPPPGQIDAGAPGGCELVVARAEDCPSIQQVCGDHICNAAHDCCYPTADGWGDVITDCPLCPDAAVDAPP